MQLAYAINAPSQAPRLDLKTLPSDEAAADAAWHKLGLPEGEQVVVLNSSGAFGAAKLWPSEYFGELARRIAERDELHVLVVCGPDERKTAEQIVRQPDIRMSSAWPASRSVWV